MELVEFVRLKVAGYSASKWHTLPYGVVACAFVKLLSRKGEPAW